MNLDLIAKALLVLFVAMLSTGCYVHHAIGPATAGANTAQAEYELAEELRDIVYSAPGWPQALHADLYLPRRAGPRPLVLTVHGGGWANRDRSDMDSISLQLVRRGYAVMNLEYRFAPRFRYPAQIEDLQQALDWAGDNAERYRFDLERINAWGYSSGAHLAALLGGIGHPGQGNSGQPRLRAVVAGGIPADLRVYEDSPIVERFMGGVPADMPERYAQASPLYHVSADDPAVFLYHGNLDVLVSPAQSTDYYDALRAAGVDTELFLHNWRGHMTMFLFGGAAESRALDFLDRVNAQTATAALD